MHSSLRCYTILALIQILCAWTPKIPPSKSSPATPHPLLLFAYQSYKWTATQIRPREIWSRNKINVGRGVAYCHPLSVHGPWTRKNIWNLPADTTRLTTCKLFPIMCVGCPGLLPSRSNVQPYAPYVLIGPFGTRTSGSFQLGTPINSFRLSFVGDIPDVLGWHGSFQKCEISLRGRGETVAKALFWLVLHTAEMVATPECPRGPFKFICHPVTCRNLMYASCASVIGRIASTKRTRLTVSLFLPSSSLRQGCHCISLDFHYSLNFSSARLQFVFLSIHPSISAIYWVSLVKRRDYL